MRRRSPVVAQPMLQAIVHARGYLQTANAVLKSLGVALFLGLACQAVLSPEDGLLACRLLMALALTHGGFVTWLSYKVLCRETEVW